jgi:hypothetical protein
MEDYLAQQLKWRSNPSLESESELAVLIIKPNSTDEQNDLISQMIIESNLKIIEQISVTLEKDEILAIYNDIFRFMPNDILFGVE